MKESKHKINSCRVCLKPNVRSGSSLFDNYKNVAISVYITSIAEVSISETDDYPHKICLPCFKQLQTAIEFKHKCESSHATLLSTLTVKKEEESISEEEWLKIEKSEEEYFEETQELTAEHFEEPGIDNDDIDDTASNTSLLEDDINYNMLDVITPNTEFKLKLDIKEYNLDDFKIERQSKPIIEQKEIVAISTKKPPTLVELGLKPSKAIDLKLVCDDCGGLFKSKCKLRVHWKNVHLPQVLTCNLCKARFSSFKLYNSHRDNVQVQKNCELLSKANIETIGKKRYYHCTLCSYKTQVSISWKYHYNKHIGVRPNICDLCGESFTQPSTLRSHKENKHQMFINEITCQYCGKVVKGRDPIYKHLRKHTAKSITCDICGKTVKAYCLKQHKILHNEEKKFKCDICNAKYTSLYGLIHHKKSHQQHKDEINCNLCMYKATSIYTMKKHKKKHKVSLNFTCETCFQLFETEKSLIIHMNNHTDKKYKCKHCQKCYVRGDHLRRHMRKEHNLYLEAPKGINKVKKQQTARVVRADEKEKIVNSSDITVSHNVTVKECS